MDRTTQLSVWFGERKVGTLVLYKRQLAAFQYADEWLSDGFSISPFSLPLTREIFVPKIDPFEGLFGVFADSLPDGWGRLLVDRLMRRNGIDPHTVTALDRLSIVGESGMGALVYRPEITLADNTGGLTLDELAEECAKILKSTALADTASLDTLFSLGGSSGGARPKVLTEIDGEDGIVKFPASDDGADIGRQEYAYALCAKRCGIEMEEVRLFPSARCEGYFGTRRFDRVHVSGGKAMRRHMVSAAGLLETSHRVPNLDYDVLMRLTLQLTDDMSECEKLFRLMCFNVFSHNRDDHSKNFTYLYLENEKRWTLSPAYDLTYSSSIGGEHATMVHGNGKNPSRGDLLAVAAAIGIAKRRAQKIADEVEECVRADLREWV